MNSKDFVDLYSTLLVNSRRGSGVTDAEQAPGSQWSTFVFSRLSARMASEEINTSWVHTMDVHSLRRIEILMRDGMHMDAMQTLQESLLQNDGPRRYGSAHYYECEMCETKQMLAHKPREATIYGYGQQNRVPAAIEPVSGLLSGAGTTTAQASSDGQWTTRPSYVVSVDPVRRSRSEAPGRRWAGAMSYISRMAGPTVSGQTPPIPSTNNPESRP